MSALIPDLVVYDIEIVKCIPERSGVRQADLEYCEGWDDHANMGIAVLCAYDAREQMPRVFLADNLAGFAKLIDGRIVAGFNNISFDDRLLAANGITVGASYDLCREVRAAVGEPRAYTPGRTRGGRRLDDLARVNLGAQKSMHGELAPVEWQRGRPGGVIDYCLRDVMLTVALLRKLPLITDPVTMQPIAVNMPSPSVLTETVP